MKFKIGMITLGLIIAIISGIKIKDTIADSVKNSNGFAIDEQSVINENVAVNEEELNQELEQTNNQENIVQTESVNQKEIKNTEKTDEKKSKTTTNNNSSEKTSIAQKEIKKDTQEKESKKEENETSVIETPKEETPVVKAPTKDDLEYWCIAGGSHHVAGDGENEHGYYSTWDKANQAFLEYTKDWTSVQYKISCCPCGLYYFWAIK